MQLNFTANRYRTIKPVDEAKLIKISRLKNKFACYFFFYYLIISKFKSKGKNVRKPSPRRSKKAQDRLAKQISCAQKLKDYEGRKFLLHLIGTLERYFPELEQKLNGLSDSRKYYEYEVRELIIGCIGMFLFKRGSRNNTNQTFKGRFTVNFERIFHVRLAHMDTVDNFLRSLPAAELEQIKRWMITRLLERKTLHKFRLLNQWFVVAIDGTGMYSYDYEPFEGCPFKEYKNGKKVWTVYVLEAKIVCINGFSLSIATEFVKSKEEYDKQDCELKAFYRLAQTIKNEYPRLPICIALDSLYPNKNVFQICKDNHWKYIINLKDGCLKTVWEEIELLRPLVAHKDEHNAQKFTKKEDRQFFFINNLEYDKFDLNWIETHVSKNQPNEKSYYAHISNIEITRKTADIISCAGRMRWKIENQGFDEQKNHGYNLSHKYNRKSFIAMRNYYQCLQIAHIINQLAEKAKAIAPMLKENSMETLNENMIAYMQLKTLTNSELKQATENNIQFRY